MPQFMKCDKCSKLVTSKLRMIQHKKACPVCNKCGNVFNDMTYTRKHMLSCIGTVESDTSYEFTIDYVKSRLKDYTEDMYFDLEHGVAKFIELISKPTQTAQVYACTDKVRYKFFRYLNDQWYEDVDGLFIQEIMMTLYPIGKKYCTSIEKEYEYRHRKLQSCLDLRDLSEARPFNLSLNKPFKDETSFHKIRKYLSVYLKVDTLPNNMS